MKYRLEVTKEYDIEEDNGYIDAIMDFIDILKKGTYDLKVKCLFEEEDWGLDMHLKNEKK